MPAQQGLYHTPRENAAPGADADSRSVRVAEQDDAAGTPFSRSTFGPDYSLPHRRDFSSATSEVFSYEDFDQPPLPPDPEVILPTFTLTELEAARSAAFLEGRDAAAAEAAAADHAEIRKTLNAIATEFGATQVTLTTLAQQSAASIAQLLLHCLGAVIPQLAARYGEVQLEAIIGTILPGLFKEPAVTVRLNPKHCTSIARQIEQYDADLAARLHIVPSESIPPGDFRIAWRNGGAVRNAAALWAEVTETLALDGLAPSRIETREIEHA